MLHAPNQWWYKFACMLILYALKKIKFYPGMDAISFQITRYTILVMKQCKHQGQTCYQAFWSYSDNYEVLMSKLQLIAKKWTAKTTHQRHCYVSCVRMLNVPDENLIKEAVVLKEHPYYLHGVPSRGEVETGHLHLLQVTYGTIWSLMSGNMKILTLLKWALKQISTRNFTIHMCSGITW